MWQPAVGGFHATNTVVYTGSKSKSRDSVLGSMFVALSTPSPGCKQLNYPHASPVISAGEGFPRNQKRTKENVGGTWMARRDSLVDLQGKSGETDNTGETGGDLAGGTGGDGDGASGDGDGASGGRDNDGAVLGARVADDGAGDLDGLGDGAGALEGDGAGLGDGDGLAAVGEGGGSRAVRGVDVNDLGNVGNVRVGRGQGGGSGGDGDGELHFVGIKS